MKKDLTPGVSIKNVKESGAGDISVEIEFTPYKSPIKYGTPCSVKPMIYVDYDKDNEYNIANPLDEGFFVSYENGYSLWTNKEYFDRCYVRVSDDKYTLTKEEFDRLKNLNK